MYARKGFMKTREKNTYNHPANSTATGMERVIVKDPHKAGYHLLVPTCKRAPT
jgi:hypothetical protein